MTEQPQPGLPPEARPLWKLDRSEQRVLFVTFVGGVASIIAAAMIVGLAIGFDRHFHLNQFHHAKPAYEPIWVRVAWQVGAGVIVGIGLLLFGNPKLSRLRRVVVRTFWVIILVFCVVGALTAIGLVAGIH